MMHFPCPTCAQTVSAPIDCAGRTSICPWCKNPVTVPSSSIQTPSPAISGNFVKIDPAKTQTPHKESSTASALARSPELAADQSQRFEDKKTPRKNNRSFVYLKAFLALVLLVALNVIGILGFGLYQFEKTNDEPLKTAGILPKEREPARPEPRLKLVQPSEISPKNEAKPAPVEDKPKTVKAEKSESHLPPESGKRQPSESAKWKFAKKLVESIPIALDSLAAMYQSEKTKALASPSTNAVAAKGENPGVVQAVKKPIEMKRRSSLSDEDLRKQLMPVPDVGLNQITVDLLYKGLLPSNARNSGSAKGIPVPPALHDYGVKFLLEVSKAQKQPENSVLPWRFGADCQMGKEAAESFHVLSNYLRACLRASVPSGDVRPDPEQLRSFLISGGSPSTAGSIPSGVARIKPEEWCRPQAVPVLMQLLQHENTPVRLLLVELLSKIEGKEATVALASRALFDLAPQVREKAVLALGERPSSEYSKILLEGFRYPWPPVADHAAEALVALQDVKSVPTMIELLNEPDPSRPFTIKENEKSLHVVREVVQISHLSSCMVCHAPSFSQQDVVRGRVSMPNEDPPPLYYAEKTGTFVRADITYLKQDFSVVQPVTNTGKWPGSQRYDYLVRTRPLSKKENIQFENQKKENLISSKYPQRESLLFALKELTGKDEGDSYEKWKGISQSLEPRERIKDGGK